MAFYSGYSTQQSNLPSTNRWMMNTPNRVANNPATATTGSTVSPTGSTIPYQQLAAALNAFMTGQAKLPYQQNLPGYDAMTQQASNIAQQQLAGEVPQDVINQIINTGAERGAWNGLGANAPVTNSAWLKALGLTSIGQQQAGQQALGNLVAQTPVPQLFNPASLFVPETLAKQELNAAAAGRTSVPSINTGGGYYTPTYSTSTPMAVPDTTHRDDYIPRDTTPTTPSNPGWGVASNSRGGYATTGLVPGTNPDYGPSLEQLMPTDMSSPGAYDYATMYGALGLPYVDWSKSGIDWSQYE